MTKHRIGLFGFGCVGQGFAALLHKNNHLDTEIVTVCVKHPSKPRPNAPGKIVLDPDEILNDPSIDIVVELIDDPEAALAIVSKALTKGKKVVSANKKMIAENLPALDKLLQRYKGLLLFEGAVCGSIPIISNIRNYYAYDDINSISGIFNGSTNYILTKVIDEKLSYDVALAEAQENGFAESDPTLDVGGYDPCFKLSILIHEAFNTYIDPGDILRIGIEKISNADVQFAKEHNLKIKLVARAFRKEGTIKAWVAPQFIDTSDKLHSIEFEYNAVKLTSDSFGDQVLTGKGAGKLPTGLAVLSDVAAIIKNINYTEKDFVNGKPDENAAVEVYLGFGKETQINWSLFNALKEKYIGKNYSHAIGSITIENLSKLSGQCPQASIIFTSGKQRENNLSRLTYRNAAISADIV